MGCICSKGISKDDYIGRSKREKGSIKSSKRLVAPSKREEVVLESTEGGNEGDGRARLIAKAVEENGVSSLALDDGEKKGVKDERARKTHQRHATVDGSGHGEKGLQIMGMPNQIQGEEVCAGWPSWLADVAPEAINGWIPRRADSFEKLDKIGQGTYSNVYKARDLETEKIVALKKVRFVNMDPESVRFMAREIHILRRLDHPNVLKLEGLVTSRMSGSLYLVFEYMEHDLAGLAANPSIKFTEQQVKCYMQQLLSGLEHCHGRGVLHRDIKGSNLLIDNNGILRIGDFGLATVFNPEQKQPMTSRVVTLWYRPPELLLGATDYGVAVDLWSTGCILAELLAGKPIMPGRTEVEQLHKIFKLCGSPSEEYWRKSKLPHTTIFKPQHPYRRCVADTFKNFSSPALGLLDVLLAIEPADRGTAASALKSEYFTTKPLACDPSSLPKYPPSKEFDAKLRDEEARRQRAERVKGHGSESGRRGPRESKAMPAPDANAELKISLQRQATSNPKSSNEKYNPLAEDAGSGFPIDPPSGISVGSTQNGFSHSGTFNVSSWNKKQKEEQILKNQGQTFIGRDLKTQRSYMPQSTTADFSNLSGLAVARSNAKSDNRREKGSTTQHHWPEQRSNMKFNLDIAEPSQHMLDRPSSSHKKGERTSNRDSNMGYGAKKNRIHYSGPLMPPGGNIDEMLKEHERQIQQAVRKARLDKAKSKLNLD